MYLHFLAEVFKALNMSLRLGLLVSSVSSVEFDGLLQRELKIELFCAWMLVFLGVAKKSWLALSML